MKITLGGQGMLHHQASALTVTTVLIFSSDGNFECPHFVFLLGLGWFAWSDLCKLFTVSLEVSRFITEMASKFLLETGSEHPFLTELV